MKWLLCALLLVGQTPEPAVMEMRAVDRVRIAEAYRLAETLGDQVWEGWSEVPFAILLVTPEGEFLIGHPSPSDDFTSRGRDELLKREVWFRERTYSTSLLATFPAVGGVSTVVIGQAENTTAATPTSWVVTLLHEHFHQLQNAQPDYYAGVNALGLARGDQTGMWMLNYAFPYDDAAVGELYAERCTALADALAAREQEDFAEKLAAYVEARAKLDLNLARDDARYLEFQVWQEGIARYTQLRIAELAAADYEPSAAFRDLADYTPFTDEARALSTGIEQNLAAPDLGAMKRVAFYALGAAEGLVLDRAAPGWRETYLADKFSLYAHFE